MGYHVGSPFSHHCGVCAMATMRYPDGLRGMVTKTGTRLVTIAVGTDIVFQGGVTPTVQLEMISLIQQRQREWDEVCKLQAEKESRIASEKAAKDTQAGTGTVEPVSSEPEQLVIDIPVAEMPEVNAHDRRRGRR